jgi:putative solute:sodium symporter small subunit
MTNQDSSTEQQRRLNRQAYWKANLRLVGICLLVWFVVSYGFGLLLVDVLNRVSLFGFKLGFWFAQQGAVYVFLVLVFYYARRMNDLDRKYGVQEDEGENGT